MRRKIIYNFVRTAQSKPWTKTKAFLRTAEQLKFNRFPIKRIFLATSLASLVYVTGTVISASSEHPSEELEQQNLTIIEAQELVYLLAHHSHFPNQIIFLPSCTEELRSEVLTRLKHKHLSRTAVARINFEELDNEKEKEKRAESGAPEDHKRLLAEMIDPGFYRLA
jgi:hypothetical protein